MTDSVHPRRSLLFVPGSHARGLEKSKKLPADVLIFDLEDGVAESVKMEARAAVIEALKSKSYGHRERIVRINRLDSREGLDDLMQIAPHAPDGIMLPKVESAEQVAQAASIAQQLGAPESIAFWANVETPLGVLKAGDVAACNECFALVAGTNDLRAGLGLPHSNDRQPLYYALQAIICAARAYGKLAFDGTYIRFDDKKGLQKECEEGKWLGFDGKTLVHPDQIAIANDVYSPHKDELKAARETVQAYEGFLEKDRSVGLVGGQMVEELHVRRALKTLQMAEKLEKVKRLAGD